MNSNMPKDSGFDKTLSVLKEGYEFVMNRDKEMHTNIFETRILGEKTICLTGSELAELFYDNTRFSRSDAAPVRVQKRFSVKVAFKDSTVMNTKTVKRCSCL